jgi:hypothetical protein
MEWISSRDRLPHLKPGIISDLESESVAIAVYGIHDDDHIDIPVVLIAILESYNEDWDSQGNLIEYALRWNAAFFDGEEHQRYNLSMEEIVYWCELPVITENMNEEGANMYVTRQKLLKKCGLE